MPREIQNTESGELDAGGSRNNPPGVEVCTYVAFGVEATAGSRRNRAMGWMVTDSFRPGAAASIGVPGNLHDWMSGALLAWCSVS